MPHSTFCVVRLFVCCDALIVVVFRVVRLCLCFACYSLLCLGLGLAIYGLFSFLWLILHRLLRAVVRVRINEVHQIQYRAFRHSRVLSM